MNQNYYNWQQLMQQVAQQNAAKQTPFLPTNQQGPPVPTSLFDKSQYSRFGNAMARGGGFGPMLNNSALQQQITTPDELEMYNQARKAARNKGLGQMMYALSDAFGGRDIGKGVQERQLAQSGGNATSLMQNEQYIARLYQLRNALPENDPQRAMFDVRIRNAEAGIGAYKYDPNRQFDITEAKRVAGSPGGLDLTPIESGIDTAFAADAAEYIYKTKAQVQANLNNLGEKINILEAGDKNVSGPGIGLTPEILAPILIPDAVAFEDDVRDVVFQSLREKLGAQFTEREGDRLVAAAFNKSLPEEVNIARLRRLYGTIEDAALAKENAIAHYNEFGTIKDYQATPLNFKSIINKLVTPTDFEGLTDEQLIEVYKSDNTTDEERGVIESIVKARG